MQPLTQPNVNATGLTPEALNNTHVMTILNNLLNALQQDNRFQPVNPHNPNIYEGDFCDCLLEFCYCFPCGQGFKNAVWVRVHNVNGRIVWFYIPFLKRDLELKIMSEDNLNGHYAPDTVPTDYYLPTQCDDEFNIHGGHLTDLGVLGNINNPVDYQTLLDTIYNEANYLCTY